MGNWNRPGVSPERFELFGGFAFGYAMLYSVLMYKNFSSVCLVLMAVMTVLFMSFCIARHERALPHREKPTIFKALGKQKKLFPGYIGILLFGAAVCRTDDTFLIVMDHVWIVFLAGACMLTYFGDVSQMGLVEYGASVLEKVAEPISYMDRFFTDYKQYNHANEGARKRSKVIYVLVGIAIAVPLLYIMISLLASADEIFGDVVETILGNLFLSWDIVWFVVFAFVALIYVYGLITAAPFGRQRTRNAHEGTQEPIIAITAMGLLTLVYLLFSMVQIFYLFLHNMSLPDGMTYAEYARQGFFQLLFVSVLNVIMVLLCQMIFEKNMVLNAVLTVMSACTYIMIASSALRMGMYIEEYGLTYLRILTYAALLLLVCILTFVIAKIYVKRFPFTICTVYAAACVCMLVSYIRPAHMAAAYNVAHQDPTEIDFYYLSNLGADAAEEVYTFIEENYDDSAHVYYSDDDSSYEYNESDIDGFHYYVMENYFEDIQETWEKKGKIRGFNFSRKKAADCAKKFFSLEWPKDEDHNMKIL